MNLKWEDVVKHDYPLGRPDKLPFLTGKLVGCIEVTMMVALDIVRLLGMMTNGHKMVVVGSRAKCPQNLSFAGAALAACGMAAAAGVRRAARNQRRNQRANMAGNFEQMLGLKRI